MGSSPVSGWLAKVDVQLCMIGPQADLGCLRCRESTCLLLQRLWMQSALRMLPRSSCSTQNGTLAGRSSTSSLALQTTLLMPGCCSTAPALPWLSTRLATLREPISAPIQPRFMLLHIFANIAASITRHCRLRTLEILQCSHPARDVKHGRCLTATPAL